MDKEFDTYRLESLNDLVIKVLFYSRKGFGTRRALSKILRESKGVAKRIQIKYRQIV